MTATSSLTGSALSPQDIGAHLSDRLGDKVLEVEVAYDQVTVTVEPETLVAAARLCKEDERLACDSWEFNCGVDLMEEGFALVTGLYSTRHRHRVLLRIHVPGGREKPVAPSLTRVYRGANWSEREAYDMFGIEFDGHPSLLPRILTVENFEGWPLRKEFLLMTREAKPWPGAKEPEERKEEGAGESAAVTPSDTPVSAEDKAAAAKAKAERAKAKAAEARKRKARERAAAEQGPEGEDQEERAAAEAGNPPVGEGPAGQEQGRPAQADGPEPQAGETADSAVVAQDTAEGTPQQPDPAIVPEAEGAGGTPEESQAEAERAAAPSAAGADVPAGTPDPSSPEGAAEIAGSAVAKDAAAGAVGGDTAAGAPGDSPLTDQPVEDLEHEAKQGEGAAPMASGAPGIEAEGRHAGADEQSGDKPAKDTPGMKADPAGGAGAPVQEVAPAPGPDPATSGTASSGAGPGPGAGKDEQPPSATMGVPSSPGGTPPDSDETGSTGVAERRDQGDDEDEDPVTGGTRPAGRADDDPRPGEGKEGERS